MTSMVGRVMAGATIVALAVGASAPPPALASPEPAHLMSTPLSLEDGVTPQLRWTGEFGTAGSDEAEGVAIDSAGNSCVVGYTAGALPGQTSQGGYDAFIRDYSPIGTEQWTIQFGSPGDDAAFGVAVDSVGNAYLAGYTSGTLPGQASAGGIDAFVRSYDPQGNELWTRQFGTAKDDIAQSIATDAVGDVYVAGYTLDPRSGDEDGWVRELAAATGDAGWTISLSSPFFDDARSVATDTQDHVIVGGAYASSAFLGYYSHDGSALWTDSFGGAVVSGVAGATGGGIVAVGTAGGALPGSTSLGGSDAFVRLYSGSGIRTWTRQLGSPQDDAANAVVVNQNGDIIVAGSTAGALPGQTGSGGSDAFVDALHPDGTDDWTVQFGTEATDLAFGLAVDGGGNVTVAGPTSGALPGQSNIGGADAYVRSYGACQIIVRVDSSGSLMPVIGSAQLGFQALAYNTGCTLAVQSVTTSQALSALQAGTINAAMVSRPLTTAEKGTLYGWQIGGDAMVLAVQNSAAMGFIDDISSAQVQGIYNGTITNWSALGGPDQPILPRSSAIDAEDRADLLRIFNVADSAEQATIAATGLPRVGSAYDEAAAAVANPYQIVYTSLADATMAGLKPLSLDGIAPSVLAVENGTYPAQRVFTIAMRKNSFGGAGLADWSTVKTEDLVNYLLTLQGQQAIVRNGYVQAVLPASQPIPDVDVNLVGRVDIRGIGAVLAHWGQTSTCPGWIRADINNDGHVNVIDVGQMLARWSQRGFVPPS